MAATAMLVLIEERKEWNRMRNENAKDEKDLRLMMTYIECYVAKYAKRWVGYKSMKARKRRKFLKLVVATFNAQCLETVEQVAARVWDKEHENNI